MEGLHNMGFNITFLTCERYVLEKLSALSTREIELIKEMFLAYRHPHLARALGVHDPYGEKQTYAERLKEAKTERLAKLIKVCGILAQTKVYLFYQQPGTP
ncbi:MAG: hypothetical protein QXX56_05765 [Candidatus Bathyarchaeia archaeon]